MKQDEMGTYLSTAADNEAEEEVRAKLLSPPRTTIFHIFLPLMYSLNEKNDKHVTVGIVQKMTSVTFTASQKCVVLPYHVWNTLFLHLNRIRNALNKRVRLNCVLKDITDGPPSYCVVKPMFGRWYVQLVDIKGDRISLSASEWFRFEQYLPSLSRYTIQIWADEIEIATAIDFDYDNDDDSHIPSQLTTTTTTDKSFWWRDRLTDEISAYKAICRSLEQTVDVKT
jgi:hypothetical protein